MGYRHCVPGKSDESKSYIVDLFAIPFKFAFRYGSFFSFLQLRTENEKLAIVFSLRNIVWYYAYIVSC